MPPRGLPGERLIEFHEAAHSDTGITRARALRLIIGESPPRRRAQLKLRRKNGTADRRRGPTSHGGDCAPLFPGAPGAR